MKNRYFLLRHGQTLYQAKRWDLFYLNDNVVGLTKKGRQQIRTAAKKLKNRGINFIYSSDFKRTKQTANIVAEELGLKVQLDKKLRDIEVGIWRGKTGDEFYQAFSKKQRFFKRPLGGESWRDARKRLKDFIKDTDKKHKNKTILIISHADPIWLVVGIFKGLTEGELLEKRYTGPGGFWPDVGQFIEL